MSTDLTVAIAGGGHVGLGTAQLLYDRGHKVVIIERNHGRCRELNDAYVGTVIEGDASQPGVLRQADPDRCDVLAALTGDAATNVGICLTAAQMTDVRTVMRVGDPEAVDEYDGLVDSIVYPEGTASRAIVNELVGGGVRSVEAIGGDLEILEIEVSPGAPAAGDRLEDVRLPRGSLIIADAHGDRISGADTVLDPGNRYLIAVESAVKGEVLNLLRG